MAEKLHDDILTVLPEDFIRRMRNWVRARDGGSVSTSRFEERVDYMPDENPLPILLGEAQDVDRALLNIPQRHQEVIKIFWGYQGHTLAWMALATPRVRLWKLGSASFKDWLEKGHDRLQKELLSLSKAEARRREMSEAMQVKT